MLGISTYIQDLDYNYLEKAAALGAKYLFSSLHIPEEDYSEIGRIIPELLAKCNELGLIYVPDISPRTFTKLGIEENDYESLKALGISALRLDYNINDFTLLKSLQEDFQIFLNASTVTHDYLMGAQEAGVDFTKLCAMHNFYPKTDTGLDVSFFESMNRTFQAFNLRIMAFVVGDQKKRFPLYEGLPTLEMHRDVHPYVAAVELIETYGVEDVVIGDSEAKLETLTYIAKYIENRVASLPVVINEQFTSYFKDRYGVRLDTAAHVVRLAKAREIDIPVQANNHRNLGSVTIENRLAGRYCGEIQICKQDLPFKASANNIADVVAEFIPLLKHLNASTTIDFVVVNQ